MTTTPDPQAVREIAREYARRLLDQLDHGYVLDEMLSDKRFAHLLTGDEDQDIATLDPIAAEIKDVARAAALLWPDEQPQDERDAALAALTAERNAAHEAAAEADRQRAEYRREAALLRARVRELEDAQDERDGDVRAVAAWLAADDEDVPAYDYIAACAALKARFAGRIAELDARDAKGGE